MTISRNSQSRADICHDVFVKCNFFLRWYLLHLWYVVLLFCSENKVLEKDHIWQQKTKWTYSYLFNIFLIKEISSVNKETKIKWRKVQSKKTLKRMSISMIKHQSVVNNKITKISKNYEIIVKEQNQKIRFLKFNYN